jgi:hypothetical protein
MLLIQQVTILMHNPIIDKRFSSEQFTHFLKNLSILGGLMVLGSYSGSEKVEAAAAKKRR